MDTIKVEQSSFPDARLMFIWRSDPDIAGGYHSHQDFKPLVWEDHITWLMNRHNWQFWTVYYHDRPVGIVSTGGLDTTSPDIGYYLGEKTLWKKGIMTKAIRQVLYLLFMTGVNSVHATVMDNNHASIRVMQKLGFKKVHTARKDEGWYVLDLTPQWFQ